MCLKNIFNADVIGTARIIPTIPHIQPHKINDINITSGEIFKFLPVILGSITFPIIIWVKTRPLAINKTSIVNPFCAIEINTGNSFAVKLPT